MACYSVELSPTALGDWIHLPSKADRVAADEALEELRNERHAIGSFQIAGELVWRLVRPRVVVLYVPTAGGAFVTGIHSRRRSRR